MKNVININGVDYIKKDTINTDDKFRELKKIVEQSLNDMQQVDKILSSYLENTTVEKEIEKTEKRHSVGHFEVYKDAQKLYKKVQIDDNGIIKLYRTKRTLDIRDIISIKKDMERMTLKGMVHKWANKFNPNHFHRIVFNIQNGVFDSFIKNFKTNNLDIKNHKTEAPIETLFYIKPYNRKCFIITDFCDDGFFRLGNGVKSQFTIYDVINIRDKVIGKKITSEKAKKIADDFNFTEGIFERIVYSLQKGVFNYYLHQLPEPIAQNDYEKTVDGVKHTVINV